MTARPCIDCGELTASTRCPACTRTTDRTRGTSTDRGYDAAWARLSARARRLHPWCVDCGTADHLTADHLVWPARTLDDIEVVCMTCNNRRGPRRGPRTHNNQETRP